MINVTRGAVVEQPDGSLVCVVRIAARDRAAFFSGEKALIALMPSQDGEHGIAPATIETPGADYEVSLDEPTPQTVGVAGFDTAKVVDALSSGEWEHPAAPYVGEIYRHAPFQRYAIQKLKADEFAAPMECANRIIAEAVKGLPILDALAAMGRLMDDYTEWAATRDYPAWPDGSHAT